MRSAATVVPEVFGDLEGVEALVTGRAAFTADVVDFYSDGMPKVIGFVLALSFILLLVAFRSIVIPIKAILLNLLSTGAAFGLLVLVFQDGYGAELLGFKPGPIEAFVPVFIFTILFGLSMDYHVFILTRIKEARDHGMSSNEAVARGIAVTAGTITSAAAIMVTVFAVFVTLELVIIKQLGFGLAVAVLLDATIVRSVLLPATMRLLGEWNWWLPSFLRLAAERDHRGRRRHAAGRDHRGADRPTLAVMTETTATPPSRRRRSATSSPGSGATPRAARTFESRNPADTRDVVGRFQQGTAADVAMAIKAAETAGPMWRRTPAPKRGEILYAFGALMAQHKERLARAMTREMGKVLSEARGDVQEGIDIAYLMAGEGRRMFGDTVPSELPDKWAMTHPPAARRGRDHHALELPDGDPVLEDDAGPRDRQHRRVQAGRATRRTARRSSSSSWPRPASRRASSTS